MVVLKSPIFIYLQTRRPYLYTILHDILVHPKRLRSYNGHVHPKIQEFFANWACFTHVYRLILWNVYLSSIKSANGRSKSTNCKAQAKERGFVITAERLYHDDVLVNITLLSFIIIYYLIGTINNVRTCTIRDTAYYYMRKLSC